MPNQKALVLTSGRVAQIVSTDNLIVGSGVDTATNATLSIGASTASAIAIGKSGQTTTLTNGATFGGNLAFANSPATPWVGVLTVGSYSINVSSAVQCTVSVTHDVGIPAPTVIIDTDTPSSVIARYGTGTTAGQLATALDGTAALSANAAISGPLPTTGGFYSVTTFGGSAGGTAYRATNLLDPSSAQDAATKNYVDTQTVLSFSGGSTGLTPSTATKGAITLAGTLAAANGGTGQSSYAVGELLYASSTTALSKLATVATGYALLSAGAAAPQWGKVGLTTHVSGTLGVGNGGTGTATAFTQGSVVFAGASGVYSENWNNFFWDNTNRRLGIGTNSPTGPLTIPLSVALAGQPGGPITLTAESGGSGNTSGGNVEIYAGGAGGTGTSGTVLLVGGGGTAPGRVVAKAGADATSTFQVQQQLGGVVFNVDTLNRRIGVNTTTPTGALHVIGNTGAASGGPTTIGAESGNPTGNNSGGNLVLTAGAAFGTGTGGSVNITAGSSPGTAGSVVLLSGSGLGAAGAVIARAGVNSTTAFRVQTSTQTNVLVVDTTNIRVGINGTPSATLSVTGNAFIDTSTNNTNAFRVRNSTFNTIFNVDTSQSRVGVLTGSPASAFSVGLTSQFQVDNTGDIVAIRGQTTTFPAANAAGVLTNNGSGTLSWAAAGSTQPVTVLTGTTTLTTANYTALCNGTFTVTLPLATGNTGRAYEIKNVGTGTITISGNGGTIDGAATYVMDTQYQAVIVRCDGTNWFIF